MNAPRKVLLWTMLQVTRQFLAGEEPGRVGGRAFFVRHLAMEAVFGLSLRQIRSRYHRINSIRYTTNIF